MVRMRTKQKVNSKSKRERVTLGGTETVQGYNPHFTGRFSMFERLQRGHGSGTKGYNRRSRHAFCIPLFWVALKGSGLRLSLALLNKPGQWIRFHWPEQRAKVRLSYSLCVIEPEQPLALRWPAF